MKTIHLPTGECAFVDDADFAYVSKYKWQRLLYDNGAKYVQGSSPDFLIGGRKSKNIALHTFLMRPDRGLQVDHIDGNGLNNCRSNLRILTQQQNTQAKRRKRPGCTSQYRGVHWERIRGKWISTITQRINGVRKTTVIGQFSSEDEAALAYNAAAIEAGFFAEAINVIT